MFEPVVMEKANRSQRIVLQIQALISKGKLKPGDKLPPERELAQMLNVSRTSVREAIRTLSTMGLLAIKKGLGVFITEANVEYILGNITESLVIKEDEIAQLFEIRMVLETQAVCWVVDRASDREVENILNIVKTAKEQIVDSMINEETARECDAKFHQGIMEATHNSILMVINQSIMHLLEKMRDKTLSIPGRAVQSIYDHERIAVAIVGRDKEKACELMRLHIESVENSI
ncbi:MAG: FadR/GntR family transcriptional regulator [Eubacteriales bacterium]